MDNIKKNSTQTFARRWLFRSGSSLFFISIENWR